MAGDYEDSGISAAILSGPTAPAFPHYAGPTFETGHFQISSLPYLTAAENGNGRCNSAQARIVALAREVALAGPRVEFLFDASIRASMCSRDSRP
jgi:hypothetical protein